MFCSKCGVENKKDSKFCKGCGGSLLASENNEAPLLSDSVVKPPKSILLYAIMPFSFFIVLIILWGFLSFITGENNSSPIILFINDVLIPFLFALTFLAIPIGIIYVVYSNSKNFDGTIKCGNCGHTGLGKKGRSTWAQIAVWLWFIFFWPITLVYYLATHARLCPKCESTFVGLRDKNGHYSAPKNGVGPLAVILGVFVAVVVIGILAAVVLASLNDAREAGQKALDEQESGLVTTDNEVDRDYFNEEEFVEYTKTYIQVLQRLYYINQNNISNDVDSVSGLIMGVTSEAMQDKNDLQKLLVTTEEMKQSKIFGASLVGLVIDTSIRQLILVHDDYIRYLRTVDDLTLDMSEFKYQMSLFQSGTKNAYMSMVESIQVFSVLFFDLNEDPDVIGEWRVSIENRREILNEIEMRFGDIYVESEELYKETQTTDATVFMVGSIQEFLEE